MKLITAIIQPFMFERLARVLRRSEQVPVFTVSETRCAGVPDSSDSIDFLTDMLRVDVFVKRDQVDEVAELIAQTVTPNNEGEGLIFVSEIAHVVNIHTGKTGQAALETESIESE